MARGSCCAAREEDAMATEAVRSRRRMKRSVEPREHVLQIDRDFGPCDAPANFVADDTALSFTAAHLYSPIPPIDEPHLLESEGEVRVALELTVIDPR